MKKLLLLIVPSLLLIVPSLLLVGCEGSDEWNKLMEQNPEEQARIKEAREKTAAKSAKNYFFVARTIHNGSASIGSRFTRDGSSNSSEI